jgi:hypothetical protein
VDLALSRWLRIIWWCSAITLCTLFGSILWIGCEMSALDDPPDASDSPRGVFGTVMELPEVLEYSRRLRASSGGSVNLISYLDGESSPGVWDVFVGESHPSHTVRWATFRVHSASGKIFVSRPDGEYVPRREWLGH